MKRFFAYGWYVVRHKWFVMLECWKRGLIWRGIAHDWHKFLPSEFVPYMRFFGGNVVSKRDKTGYYKAEDTGDRAFDRAWFLHQKRSWHHWQSWCVPKEGGAGVIPHEIPLAYLQEMVCDWLGAGRAQGKPDVMAWYEANAHKLVLCAGDRAIIEQLLAERFGRQPVLTREGEVRKIVEGYHAYERGGS